MQRFVRRKARHCIAASGVKPDHPAIVQRQQRQVPRQTKNDRARTFPLDDWLWIAPGVTASSQQFIRSFWSPPSREIEFLLGQFEAAPCFADRIDYCPCSLHFVAANEKRSIAGERFQQQPFISLWRISAELRIIAEVHADGTQLQTGSRNLAIETERDSFVRLQSNRDGVGVELWPTLGGEQHVGRGPKLHSHFAGAEREAFACAQIKRHARPAPVIDQETSCHKCFHIGIRCDFLFLAVGDAWLAIYFSFDILTAHDAGGYLTRQQRAN